VPTGTATYSEEDFAGDDNAVRHVDEALGDRSEVAGPAERRGRV
jgi:hypothetical protein